jgi:hypothetical protein
MNENIPSTLTQFVEQMLEAVPTGDVRKQAMREELLAHLLAVYADELECTQNEKAATAAAKRRFGDAATLSGDLRAAVSWLDWTCFHTFGRKGNLMRWLFVILGVVAFFIGTGLICPALAQMVSEGNFIALAATLFVVGSALTLAGIWSVVHGVRKFRMT